MKIKSYTTTLSIHHSPISKSIFALTFDKWFFLIPYQIETHPFIACFPVTTKLYFLPMCNYSIKPLFIMNLHSCIISIFASITFEIRYWRNENTSFYTYKIWICLAKIYLQLVGMSPNTLITNNITNTKPRFLRKLHNVLKWYHDSTYEANDTCWLLYKFCFKLIEKL